MRRSSGLTLVELMVVLVILAAVAGVAVTATESAVDQSRYESTRRGLAGVESAILGEPGGPAGFVADVGRLPVRSSDADATRALAELWVRPSGVPECALRQPLAADDVTVLDAEVTLAAGWRGPYLRLPLGAPGLRDGWNAAFLPLAADGSTVTVAGADVSGASSLGADGATGGAGIYDGDLAVQSAPRHVSAVSGTVTRNASGAALVVVRVYGPVNGVVRDLADPLVITATDPQSFTFTSLPAGPRAVRAYQVASSPARDQPLPSAPTHRSRVRHVTLVPGGIAGVALDLE